jgi:hypothetical protein
MKGIRLSRRTMLRGIGGALVGLPILECMLNSKGEAFAQAGGGLPKRYAIVFAGQAIGGDGWAEDMQMVGGVRTTEAGHFIVPAQTGAGYTLTTPLQPLNALVNDFSLVSNLSIPYSKTSTEGSQVPPGGAFRDFHGGGCGPLLCGTRSTSPSFTCQSITSDQVISDLNKGLTSVDHIVVRAQPSWYLSGSSFAGRQYISYAQGGEKIEAQTSPQIVFRSLFGGFVPDDGAEAAQHEFNQRSRKSVLSLITAKRQALVSKVGAADRMRLERHFDEIAALEKRIDAAPPVVAGACQLPPDPGADLPVGGDNAGSGSDSIGTNTGYSGETERARLLADLIYMAFVCDITRAATLQLTVFQSHMNVFPITEAMGTPIRADLHEVGHNGDQQNRGQLPVSLCLQWHISHYAYLLDKLKSATEGAGNALDNSAIVFLPEAGHGTQLNDATSQNQTHSVEKMVMLVGGRAGGLAPGRHIDATGKHPVQGLISAMQAAGYTGDTLGEVTGNVPELFG